MKDRPPTTWQNVASLFLVCLTVIAVVWIVAGCGSTEDSTEPVPVEIAAVPDQITSETPAPTTGPEPTPVEIAPPVGAPPETDATSPGVAPKPLPVAQAPKPFVAPRPAPVPVQPAAPRPVRPVIPAPAVVDEPAPVPQQPDEQPVPGGACPPSMPGFQSPC